IGAVYFLVLPVSVSTSGGGHARERVSRNARAAPIPRRLRLSSNRGSGSSSKRDLRQAATALRGESRPDTRGRTLPRTRCRLQSLSHGGRGRARTDKTELGGNAGARDARRGAHESCGCGAQAPRERARRVGGESKLVDRQVSGEEAQKR